MSVTSSLHLSLLCLCVNGIYIGELDSTPKTDTIYAVYVYEPENE